MRAFIDMEERFARLTICFTNSEQEKLANKTADELIKKYELNPLAWETKSENGVGQTALEFEDESDEFLRPFFDEICKTLDLKFEDTTVAHSE